MFCFIFKKSKWDILLPVDCLLSTRCAREESQKIQYKFNKVKHKLANTQIKKTVLTPIMKTIMKSIIIDFIPPKWKKFNTLHKMNRRISRYMLFHVILHLSVNWIVNLTKHFNCIINYKLSVINYRSSSDSLSIVCYFNQIEPNSNNYFGVVGREHQGHLKQFICPILNL